MESAAGITTAYTILIDVSILIKDGEDTTMWMQGSLLSSDISALTVGSCVSGTSIVHTRYMYNIYPYIVTARGKVFNK